MRILSQSTRQPGKTLLLILLATIALAVLVVCVGQYIATILARADLEDGYETVAVISDEYFYGTKPGGGRVHYSNLPEEIQNWADTVIAGRPDLVKTEFYAALYSAYAPGLCHDNYSQYENGNDPVKFGIGVGDPYRCAMLEVKLTKIGTVVYEETVRKGASWDDMQEFRTSISILCLGTIEKAIGVEQGFASPVGKTIVLTVETYDEAAMEALKLEAGKHCLVYGVNYSDTVDSQYKTAIQSKLPLYAELFDSEDIEQIEGNIDCHMTVCNYVTIPVIIRENGVYSMRTDLREYYFFDENGFAGADWYKKYVSAEEIEAKYAVPTIVMLSGTTESFFSSERAALWQRTLKELEYNLHGFPVLAVDKLGYQMAFARGDARIVEGRDFTEAERTESHRVCVISETVAQINGLQVGDTINLQTYVVDPNVGGDEDNGTIATAFPAAAIYSGVLGFSSEMESYTIVGLYRQNNAWQDEGFTFGNPYGFSPDTIFVPTGSISGQPITGRSGNYYSLVLHNGKMTEFRDLQAEAGYPDLFICMDGGYTDILNSLNAFESVSCNALLIGLAAYGVIMVLLMVLVPLQQRRSVLTMASLGTTRGRKIVYVLVNALCVLGPGSILGGLVGALLWDKVAVQLMESVNINIPLEANMAVTAPTLVALHLVLMVVVVLLIAIPITSNRGLIKRK